MESFYPVGTSKFNIRAATETGWTRWSSHRVFKIDSDEPPQEPTWDVKMANDPYPGLGPHLHVGDFYPSDSNFVHVSVRHTFLAGAKEYQVCVIASSRTAPAKAILREPHKNFSSVRVDTAPRVP